VEKDRRWVCTSDRLWSVFGYHAGGTKLSVYSNSPQARLFTRFLSSRCGESAIDHILHGYEGTERCEITYAGSISFDGRNPHIWYVISRVWTGKDSQTRSVGQDSKEYETPGRFWLNTKAEWV
jgi:hypothetical protein